MSRTTGATLRLAVGMATATTVVTAGLVAGAPTAADASAFTGRYVALGDSFTSGPLIPTQVDLNCVRSNRNYPSLAAASIQPASFTDVSCGGASTGDILNPSTGQLGLPVPAQINAVDATAALVTIQIGGNDIGFFGYIALLPDTGYGCWPVVPIAYGDVPYLRTVHKSLNSMLATTAAANGARYIDVYTPSIGHDSCKSSSVRWVEGLFPQNSAAPFHPNAAGEQGMASTLIARLNG